MEVFEILLLGNLIQSLMETDYPFVVIARSLPVIVDTIQTQILQEINHRLGIGISTIRLLRRNDGHPAFCTYTTGITGSIEELHTAQ